MLLKKILSVLSVFLAAMVSGLSQVILMPNSGLKSHQTLELNKIELTPERTTVAFTIENRIEGGNFCADKNIFIIYPDGTRSKLISATGIPHCPEIYKFKSIGEKLNFSLVFPPLKKGTEWIDIVEECSSNCFHFYGITLNMELNDRLDHAFVLATTNTPEKNIILFRSILESVVKQNPGIEGTLYINIINAANEAGDKVEAAVWYKRLLESKAPRVNEYIKFLNDRGIRY
jgi:hypothetical protein